MSKTWKDYTNSELREIVKSDIEKIKNTTPTDPNGLKYKWNEKRTCFISHDDKNREWVMALQNTKVPAYWWTCKKITTGGNKCNNKHPVFVYQNNEETNCFKCGQNSVIKLEELRQQLKPQL